MLHMTGGPMIETTISKGNTFNDFNFVIASFIGSLVYDVMSAFLIYDRYVLNTCFLNLESQRVKPCSQWVVW